MVLLKELKLPLLLVISAMPAVRSNQVMSHWHPDRSVYVDGANCAGAGAANCFLITRSFLCSFLCSFLNHSQLSVQLSVQLFYHSQLSVQLPVLVLVQLSVLVLVQLSYHSQLKYSMHGAHRKIRSSVLRLNSRNTRITFPFLSCPF